MTGIAEVTSKMTYSPFQYENELPANLHRNKVLAHSSDFPDVLFYVKYDTDY